MASSSTTFSIPTIDPNTHHISVTAATPPDQWLRNMYKVSTIRDVLREHVNEFSTNPSVLQQRAVNRLTGHILNDLGRDRNDPVIDWYADVGQITNDLDVIFFRGLVNRDSQVVYFPEPNGIRAANSPEGIMTVGHTNWDSPGRMNLNILFDTRDLGFLRRPTRILRRSSVLGTLLHEMVHAFFDLYACQSADCCMDTGGDFSVLIGGEGHGEAWSSAAMQLALVLLETFPLLQFPDSPVYIYPSAVPGAPGRVVPDALGVSTSVSLGNLPPNPPPNPQPGPPPNPQQSQP